MRPIPNFKFHALAAAALIAFAATSAAGAIYMKYGSIKGEVAVKDGKVGDGWIEIDSYQWGAARGVPDTAGSTREASAPSVSEIAVSKASDTASTKLARPATRGSMTFKMPAGQCMVGARHPSATLDTGIMRYEMENVFITSCAMPSLSSGGGSQPMEEISFNYEQIKVVHTKQDKQAPKTDVRGWDPKKKE